MDFLDDWGWLIVTVAGGGAVAALSRQLGLGRARTIVCVVMAVGGTLVVTGGFLFVGLSECVFAEDRPLAWQWSPRREFCSEPGSPARLGGFSLLLVPTALVSVGAILWSKVGSMAAAVVFPLVAATSLLPALYVSALPYYPIHTTPVLHDPYLRVAAGDRPARACYVYAIKHGPRHVEPTENTERVCVDLEPTEEALALTPDYDQGVTMYGLDWLGKTLTENGMDTGTEWEGLVVERVYRLPGPEAREDAVLVRT